MSLHMTAVNDAWLVELCGDNLLSISCGVTSQRPTTIVWGATVYASNADCAVRQVVHQLKTSLDQTTCSSFLFVAFVELEHSQVVDNYLRTTVGLPTQKIESGDVVYALEKRFE